MTRISPRSKLQLANLLRLSAVLGVGSLALLPVALLLLSSFARHWYWPALWPSEFCLRAWVYFAAPAAGLREAFANSVALALAVTLLALLIALPAARALALHEFSGKRAVLFALLIPVLTPALTAAFGAHALFLRYGLTDSWLGVLLAHLVPTVPYCTLMLTGSLANFEVDYEAQARTLGASSWAVWRYVTLPAIAPGLAVAGVFAFLISWSQYLTTALIGGGRIVTLPLQLVAFQRSGDEAVAAALALVFLAPTLGVFLAVGKFFKTD